MFAKNLVNFIKQNWLRNSESDLFDEGKGEGIDNYSALINPDAKNVCITNISKLIFAHLNINSFKNKFDILDILMVSKTKLDHSFTVGQF